MVRVGRNAPPVYLEIMAANSKKRDWEEGDSEDSEESEGGLDTEDEDQIRALSSDIRKSNPTHTQPQPTN